MLALNGVALSHLPAFKMTSFKDRSRYGLSLTLGGGEVRMTSGAFSITILVNLAELSSILKVTDRNKKFCMSLRTNFKADVRKPLRDAQLLISQANE